MEQKVETFGYKTRPISEFCRFSLYSVRTLLRAHFDEGAVFLEDVYVHLAIRHTSITHNTQHVPIMATIDFDGMFNKQQFQSFKMTMYERQYT